MVAGTLDAPMAAKRKTLPIKLHEDVVESARVISAINNVVMADLLSDILRPVLKEMESRLLAERVKAIADPPAKPKGGK